VKPASIAKFIRRSCDIPIAVGGHHANAAASDIIKEPAVNFVCKGEGEIPLLELVNRLENGQSIVNIPNMLIKQPQGRSAEILPATGTLDALPTNRQTKDCNQQYHIYSLDDDTSIIENPVGRWIDDLGDLPFEDREIFDYKRIVDSRNGWAEVLASRGCPYACTYCFNVPFFEMYQNDLKNTANRVRRRDFIRRRSVESTVAMLEAIKEKYDNVRYFTFVDDVFAIYSRWLADLAPIYKERVGLPFACTSQPLAFNKNIAHLLKEMGYPFELGTGLRAAEEILMK